MNEERAITRSTPIIEALEKCPKAAEVFEAHGLECPTCMGATMETIEEIAVLHDVEIESLLNELNAACADVES